MDEPKDARHVNPFAQKLGRVPYSRPEIRATFRETESKAMILRQSLLRLSARDGINLCRKSGWNAVRCASVSSQIHQPPPERPPRTDYLEKYQEKLERKAKEYVAALIPTLTG